MDDPMADPSGASHPSRRSRATYHAQRVGWRRMRALTALALGVACSPPATDAPEGTPSETHPPRIVAVGPDLCRVLVELGVGPAVVGVDSPSLAIPALAGAVDLGGPEALSADLAKGLAPDLVLGLAADDTPVSRWLAELEAMEGLHAVRLAPRDSNEVVAAIHRVGRLVGRELRAVALAARLTGDVAQIATRRDGRHRVVAAWVLDAAPLTVVGGSGILHELLELAGAENAFHTPEDERIGVGAAQIAERAPEIVIGPPEIAAQVPGARAVSIDPRLAVLPLLDLPARVEALHTVLYPDAAAP
jgi:ABC-type Fe3+-hydroxamate transport system substrate-binding protein